MIDRAMHPASKAGIWSITALLAVLIPFYLFLPLSAGSLFASPDETSYAAVIRELSWYGRVSIPDKIVTEFPWLHPRSFVSRGANLVPVGFLGWPWLLSLFAFVLGQTLIPILASLVAVSMAYPLYRLMQKPFGDRLAFLGTLVAMTIPGLIVFGNRALFPQIAVLSFAVWSVWLLRHLEKEKRVWPFAIAGLLIALALASRPTELPWLLPWLVWAGWDLRPTRKQIVASVVAALIPFVVLGYHAQVAYGGFWRSGYSQRDNIVVVSDGGATHASPLQNEKSITIFPFGFHPKNIARNGWHFLVGLQWPWMIVLVMAAYFIGRDVYMSRDRRNAAPASSFAAWAGRRFVVPGLVTWTILWLIFYYGQGLYMDNINGEPTVANSFIRYLLPIGPVVGLASVFLFRRYEKMAIPVAAFLVCFGVWTAYGRDAEGLLATRGELVRYASVRETAVNTFGPQDVILSERSDKIFFPAMRAVSPLPTSVQVGELSRKHPEMKIGLYARPLSQTQADAWRMAGFDPLELMTSGREKLYLLRPISR